MSKLVFEPKRGQSVRPTQIMMRVDSDRKVAIKKAADSFNLSLEEFCRQAMEFALEHLGKP